MLHKLWEKCREAMSTVLPVTLIILILSLTPLYDLSATEIIVFIICAILLIIGIAFFSLGSEIATEPMGQAVGSTIFKSKKIIIVVIICFFFGFILTIAEPDVTELAELSEGLSIGSLSSTMGIYISIGAGLFLVLGLFRILFKKDLGLILYFSYFLIFALVGILVYTKKEVLLGLIFDTGGVTTGAVSVPFLMALSISAAQTIGGHSSKSKAFGLIALCSIGPIIVMLVRAMFIDGNSELAIEVTEIEYGIENNGLDIFIHACKDFLIILIELLIELGILCLVFFLLNIRYIRLNKHKIKSIIIGILFTLFGSSLFLTASAVGFHPIGFEIGSQLSDLNPVWLVLIGFSLGIFVSLAEPPVHILCHRVEEVTMGGVSKRSLLVALSIGVGISIALCMLRIVFDFSILFYLVPGYIIALGLIIFVPRINSAIAFDAGGVASGPVTLSLIMPLAVGACSVMHPESVLADAFGIVAMVSLVPLITIQLLGFKDIMKKKRIEKNRLKNILSTDDERIIRF
ncbi:MAG: DUF1538 domain-containing protein [Acholeplasmatales bacterium]|nr:DUF1538 domain-containing protein [Acholeplasmatales bacterium]